MPKTQFIGTGSHLPEQILTNADIEKLCDTTDEWIQKRTGIKQRHAAPDGVGSSDLGTPAARKALEQAGVEAKDVDAVICCTVTPDQVAPATAIIIQANIGADNACAFDLNAACSGFLYGIASANGMIETGLYRTILLIGAETTTRLLNWANRDTAVLFADGAGAVVLRASDTEGGVLSMHLGADGRDQNVLSLPEGGFKYKPTPEHLAAHPYHILMNGPELFKRAVNKFEESIRIVLEKAGLNTSDIALFVPHQANIRIIDAACRKLDFPMDRVAINLDRVGNTVAASIPIALDEAHRAGRIKRGDYVLFAGFGAGLTWGAAVVRW